MDEELLNKISKTKFKGNIKLENKCVRWELKNNLIISIYIGNFESYVSASLVKNNKEKIITHWHTPNDELLEELQDINSKTLVIKKNFLRETVRIIPKEKYEPIKYKNNWISKYYINTWE